MRSAPFHSESSVVFSVASPSRAGLALRLLLGLSALLLTAAWFAEVEWSAFWSAKDWARYARTSAAPPVSNFLLDYSGLVVGVLTALATAGRALLVVATVAAVVAVTVAAFFVMPWDDEVEGGSGEVIWWAGTAVVAALIGAGLTAGYRRLSRGAQAS